MNLPPVMKLPLTLFALIPVASHAQWSERTVWEESTRGCIVIEAENIPDLTMAGWNADNQIPGFSGDGYIQFNGTQSSTADSVPYDSIPDTQRLSVFLKISTPGFYQVRVVNYHQREDGDNDVWMSNRGSDWYKIHDHDAMTWSTDDSNSGFWNSWLLPASENLVLLQLAGRSKGFSIDRIQVCLKSLDQGQIDLAVENARVERLLNNERYLWSDAFILEQNWRYQAPFGFFHDAYMPWVYFHGRGWIYCLGESVSNFYIYDAVDGWLWAGAEHFPSVYSLQSRSWIPFLPANDPAQ